MKHGMKLGKYQVAVLDDARSKGMTLHGIAEMAGVPYWDFYAAYSGRNLVGRESFIKILAFINDYIKANNVMSDFIVGKK